MIRTVEAWVNDVPGELARIFLTGVPRVLLLLSSCKLLPFSPAHFFSTLVCLLFSLFVGSFFSSFFKAAREWGPMQIGSMAIFWLMGSFTWPQEKGQE